MNMIGRISGKDWSEAPEGATHIKKYSDGKCFWYKFLQEAVFWNEVKNEWHVNSCHIPEEAKVVSKEEDLGMNVNKLKVLKI